MKGTDRDKYSGTKGKRERTGRHSMVSKSREKGKTPKCERSAQEPDERMGFLRSMGRPWMIRNTEVNGQKKKKIPLDIFGKVTTGS